MSAFSRYSVDDSVSSLPILPTVPQEPTVIKDCAIANSTHQGKVLKKSSSNSKIFCPFLKSNLLATNKTKLPERFSITVVPSSSANVPYRRVSNSVSTVDIQKSCIQKREKDFISNMQNLVIPQKPASNGLLSHLPVAVPLQVIPSVPTFTSYKNPLTATKILVLHKNELKLSTAIPGNQAGKSSHVIPNLVLPKSDDIQHKSRKTFLVTAVNTVTGDDKIIKVLNSSHNLNKNMRNSPPLLNSISSDMLCIPKLPSKLPLENISVQTRDRSTNHHFNKFSLNCDNNDNNETSTNIINAATDNKNKSLSSVSTNKSSSRYLNNSSAVAGKIHITAINNLSSSKTSGIHSSHRNKSNTTVASTQSINTIKTTDSIVENNISVSMKPFLTTSSASSSGQLTTISSKSSENFNNSHSSIGSTSKSYLTMSRRLSREVRGSSLDDEEDTEREEELLLLQGPSQRWPIQPKSYRGPRREQAGMMTRRAARRAGVLWRSDTTTTTDGETSGMGSSLDELVESSTESASECQSSSSAQGFVLHSSVMSSSNQGAIQHQTPTSALCKPAVTVVDKPGSSASSSGKHFKFDLSSSSHVNFDISRSQSSSEQGSSLFLLPSSSSNSCDLKHSGDANKNSYSSLLSPSRLKTRFNTLRSPSVHSVFTTKPEQSSDDLMDTSTVAPPNSLLKCLPVKRRGGWPKGRKRKPELPGAKPPKAPLTAYVLFLTDRRKHYNKTQHNYTFGEVTKLIGAEWSSLSQEQRAVYTGRSEQEKRRYRNELQAYRQSHDFQLIMRKKRLKRALSGGNPEDSSDCTDGPEDDAPEELYCSKCDKLFNSMHNKRLHLYGRPHNKAQPVRKLRSSPVCTAELTTDNTDYNTDNNTDYNTDYNTDNNTDYNTDYNTDNNTDYDEGRSSSSTTTTTTSVHQYFYPHPVNRSSSATSRSTSPRVVSASSPATSVPATSASEDEDPTAGSKRVHVMQTDPGVAGAIIAEEGNDGDREDGGTDDDGPLRTHLASGATRGSLSALRAQLAEREREIRRLRAAVQLSQQQRALLQRTLQQERQQQQYQERQQQQKERQQQYQERQQQQRLLSIDYCSSQETGRRHAENIPSHVKAQSWEQEEANLMQKDKQYDDVADKESGSGIVCTGPGVSAKPSDKESEFLSSSVRSKKRDCAPAVVRRFKRDSGVLDATSVRTDMLLNAGGGESGGWKRDRFGVGICSQHLQNNNLDRSSVGFELLDPLGNEKMVTKNRLCDSEDSQDERSKNITDSKCGFYDPTPSSFLLGVDDNSIHNSGQEMFLKLAEPLEKTGVIFDAGAGVTSDCSTNFLSKSPYDTVKVEAVLAPHVDRVPDLTLQGNCYILKADQNCMFDVSACVNEVASSSTKPTTATIGMDSEKILTDKFYVEESVDSFSFHVSDSAEDLPCATHGISPLAPVQSFIAPHITTISSIGSNKLPVRNRPSASSSSLSNMEASNKLYPRKETGRQLVSQTLVEAASQSHFDNQITEDVRYNVTVDPNNVNSFLSVGSNEQLNDVLNTFCKNNNFSVGDIDVKHRPKHFIEISLDNQHYEGSCGRSGLFRDKNLNEDTNTAVSVPNLFNESSGIVKNVDSKNFANKAELQLESISSKFTNNRTFFGVDERVQPNFLSNSITSVQWTTPNRKINDSNIDSDSSTDFVSSNPRVTEGSRDLAYSTDTEDYFSDTMSTISTSANLNQLNLIDELSRQDADEVSGDDGHVASKTLESFLTSQFNFDGEHHDLLDLNELLGRCLQEESVLVDKDRGERRHDDNPGRAFGQDGCADRNMQRSLQDSGIDATNTEVCSESPLEVLCVAGNDFNVPHSRFHSQHKSKRPSALCAEKDFL